MKILGISSFYHDSAAAIIVDGEIVAAAQEERFSRIKHDPSFPKQAIQYCLEAASISLENLDAVAFYDKPFLKFERLLETYYGFAPKGLASFIKSVPIWVKEKLFLKRNIKKYLQDIEPHDAKQLKLLFPAHHLSHSASAFYPSPFEEAAVLTVDGVGEWATASISHAKGRKMTLLKELHFPHSLGLLYSSFTYYLGFKVNSGEYKLMGLAPYGNDQSNDFSRYVSIIKKHLVEIKSDGSIRLNQQYFNYATGLRMVHDKRWEKLFGLKKRMDTEELNQQHMDLALAIQRVTEEVVLLMAKEAQRLTGSKNLCLAGGVALNCVSNGKLQATQLFEQLWIQPAAGDAGGALGAALAAHHLYFEKELAPPAGKDKMQGAYLGPAFHNGEVEKMAKKHKAAFHIFQDFDALAQRAAEQLQAGLVVGWFQGRMEFGPRALGHRSILSDPRNPEMQRKLNLKIKYRESFRPFAPSVLAHAAKDYFDMDRDSPYMLFVKNVQAIHCHTLPEQYAELPLLEKLMTKRSAIPAVTHVDFSARVQTVDGQHNERYHRLIQAFEKLTACSLLINTSFNVRGEPIVCTPEDAYRCFMCTDMDVLVINDYLFIKEEQPNWALKDKWEATFTLD